jgi:hypothetical protein
MWEPILLGNWRFRYENTAVLEMKGVPSLSFRGKWKWEHHLLLSMLLRISRFGAVIFSNNFRSWHQFLPVHCYFTICHYTVLLHLVTCGFYYQDCFTIHRCSVLHLCSWSGSAELHRSTQNCHFPQTASPPHLFWCNHSGNIWLAAQAGWSGSIQKEMCMHTLPSALAHGPLYHLWFSCHVSQSQDGQGV